MATGSRSSDIEVLLLFKDKNEGHYWNHREGWDDNVIDLNNWFGVTATANGRVVRLELPAYFFSDQRPGLVGRIPAIELGELGSVKFQLKGSIPVELGQLDNLVVLDISNNEFKGSIPVQLGQLGSLESLKISNSRLTDNIPVELGQLNNLVVLDLSNNKLTGSIPVELGQLGSLETLNISLNQLTGNIPVKLGHLSSLKSLDVSKNKLIGKIPVELGQLGSLTSLDISKNQITGNIPVKLGDLKSLTSLDISKNQLTGSIPVELGQLSNLKLLNFFRNQLTGNIPVKLGELSRLTSLDIWNNQLTGSIPVELGQLGSLTRLDISGNQLTGSIPVELGQLGSLKSLHISHNQLRGIIPVELGHLTKLEKLYISNNQLTGFGDVEDALKLVTRFVSIVHLHLDNNPWRMPPEAVVEQGLKAVQTFLKDVKDAKDAGAPTTPLQLLKLVLVGSSRAGKTSLINSIAEGKAAPTEGKLEEPSTVGIELQTQDFGNTTVEFYDCGGQLDYAGMHQTFLSKRALYLLVWDVMTFKGLPTNSNLDKVIREKIMPWLTILHLRAPKATVMLVANKCDGAIEKYSEVADRVEQRARTLLDEWQRLRGLGGRNGQLISKMSWLSGPNLISCRDYTGIAELVKRISNFGSTFIEVPPSWDLALVVINALRKDRAPLAIVSEYLGLTERPPDVATRRKWTQTLVTRQELSREWLGVVLWVKSKLEARAMAFDDRELAALNNPENALEGALWISEFAGRILRFDGDEGLFLDVVWLSKVLSPIMSHKLGSECLPSSALSPLRDDLVNKGILRVDFARHLWKNVLDNSTVEAKDRIFKGLYRVLLELGVILPLGRTTLLGIDGRISRSRFENEGNPQDVLVVMRLPKTDDHVSEELRQARAAEALEGAREVMLKWRFDPAGAPEGFVERLISSCNRIDEVEMELCWRYGGFFKSTLKVRQHGRVVRLFTFMIRYDELDAPRQGGGRDRVLSLRMIGPLEDERVWKALRYVASAMVILSDEWPGVLWEGWSQCPKHRNGILYLAPPHEANVGGPLLPATSRSECDCSLEKNAVQQLVRKHLGNVLDTRKGDPFANMPSAFNSSAQDTSPSSRSTIRVTHAPGPISLRNTSSNQTRGAGEVRTLCSERSCCRLAFGIWRENAWHFAGSFGGLALTIFFGGTLVGIVEGIEALWIIASIFVGMLTLGAIVSSAIACRDSIVRRRRDLAMMAIGPRLEGGIV